VGDVKIRYYVTRQRPGARKWGYWAPCLARGGKPTLMATLGFKMADCGEDGPHAWAIAHQWNARWDIARAKIAKGETPESPAKMERIFPAGSLGEAFARFRGTKTWLEKKPRTREDWLRGWKHIEPIFGDVDPKTVSLEDLDSWYAALLAAVGIREAHRAMKIWRALWRIAGTLKTARGGKYCERDQDPSLGIRRKTPKPRNAIWFEGEAVRLVKRAWRMHFHGLAVALAVAWDSMLSPVDVRTLTPAQLRRDARGPLFTLDRTKTGAPAIATLSKRTARLLEGYLATLPTLHPDAPIFRTRGHAAGPGRPRPPVPYTADTLGDDFRAVREAEFPGDTRQLMDFRRSGSVEAEAGEADERALAKKMGNTIDRNRALRATYLPPNATVVRLTDEARVRGRRRLRDSGSDRK
jgi:hypothetical protein